MAHDLTVEPRAPQPWWLLAIAPVLVWHASAGPHVFDAGELVAAAWQLGASHPPGQPMHALLGHAATWIPIGPIQFRIALLSVATELLAAYLVARLTHDLVLLGRPAGSAPRDTPAQRDDGAQAQDGQAAATPLTSADLVQRLAPHAAALGALLSPPLLAQATRVEVYGLALVFSVMSMRALLAWSNEPRLHHLLVGAFAAGLASTVHPPHGLALVAFGAVLALARWRHLRVRSLLMAAGAFLVAALALAHLPLRALAGAPMWGEPTTWATFVDYVTARAYAQNVGVASDHALWDQTGAVVRFLVGIAPIATLLSLAARRWALLAATLAMSTAAMLQPLDAAIPDMVAYLAPAIVLLVSVGAASIARLPLRRSLAIPCVLALVLPGIATTRILDDLDANHPELETLAGIYLESPTPRSVVIADTDFVAAAWMEAQAIEGARPDALLVISGLITSSWHWKTFTHHPLFDGTPVRGPGEDSREAYLLGVGIRAKDQVDLVSELDRWSLPGARGPYAQSQPAIRVGRDWLPKLVGDAWPVEGDGAVAAIVRHGVARHAHRLASAGHPWAATQSLRWIVNEPPSGDSLPAPMPAMPAWVDDTRDFLTSERDVRRLVAATLVRGGDVSAAIRLLRARPEELDVVQLAAIQMSLGDTESAERSVAAVREPEALRWAAELRLTRQ